MAAGAARGSAALAGGVTTAYRAGGASGVATSGLAKGAETVMSPLRRAAGSPKSSFEGGGSRAATGEGSSAGTDAAASASTSAAASSANSSPPAWARRMKRAQTINHGTSAAAHAVRSGDHGGAGTSVDLTEGQ